MHQASFRTMRMKLSRTVVLKFSIDPPFEYHCLEHRSWNYQAEDALLCLKNEMKFTTILHKLFMYSIIQCSLMMLY